MGQLVCYEYRNTIKTQAITKTILLDNKLRVMKPLKEKRSRTGAHGEDCYTEKYAEKAIARVRISISNKGHHYCDVDIYKKPDNPLAELKLMKRILDLHACERVKQRLVELYPQYSDLIMTYEPISSDNDVASKMKYTHYEPLIDNIMHNIMQRLERIRQMEGQMGG